MNDHVTMSSDGAGESGGISGPAWERTVHLLVPPQDVNEVHESVGDLWTLNADLGSLERMRFETALVELAGNVIEHAAGEQRLLCSLVLKRTPTALEALLTDTGVEVKVPFRAAMPDPEEMSESGRGVALIEMLMDDFSYERDAAGNRWRLRMQLPVELQQRATTDGAPTAG